MRLIRLLSRPLAITIVLGCLFLLVNAHILGLFWNSAIMPGWDGSSHAMIGKYYAEHIFPAMAGWTDLSFRGMPFPQFYPPLFYFIVALASKLFPWGYAAWFKILTTISLAIIPGMIAWISGSVSKDRKAAWFAGLVALFVISTYYDLGVSGVSVQATLNSGLYPQLIGFLCLLGWLKYFLEIETSMRARFAAGFFLFLTFLSNIHIVFAAGIIFGIITIARLIKPVGTRMRVLALHLLSGVLPLAAAGFWYVPMLFRYPYVVGIPIKVYLGGSALSITLHWLMFFIAVLLAAAVSFKAKNRQVFILSLAAAALFLSIIAWPSALLGAVIVQTYRWFAVYIFISAILAGYVVGKAAGLSRDKRMRGAIFICCLYPFFFWFIYNLPGRNQTGFFSPETVQTISSITDYFKAAPPGVVLVENIVTDDSPLPFAINSKLADAGIPTAFAVFRESSANSLAMVPLVDTFSNQTEAWGIQSYLATDTDFRSQPMNDRVRRAAFMGVEYLLIRSKTIKDQLATSTEASKVSELGDWWVYAVRNKAADAAVPSVTPTLIFANLDLKARSMDSYDFMRFQEELLFTGGYDQTFVRANDADLSHDTDLKHFQTAIVTHYSYSDLQKAIANLKKFSETRTLILLESKDPLYQALAKDKSSIITLPRLQSNEIVPNQLRAQMPELLAILQKTNSPLSGTMPTVETANDKITVNIEGKQQTPLPIYIRTSYFPTWKASNGQSVYMATPAYMLTFATSTFEMTMDRDPLFMRGSILALIACLVSALIAYRYRSNILRRRS